MKTNFIVSEGKGKIIVEVEKRKVYFSVKSGCEFLVEHEKNDSVKISSESDEPITVERV